MCLDQTSAPALRLRCRQELSAALLAMPALAELRLSGVRLHSISGLDDCLRT
jgi:hypothetical protein